MQSFSILLPAAACALYLSLRPLFGKNAPKDKQAMKRALRRNLCAFGAMCLLAVLLPAASAAGAAGAEPAAVAASGIAQGLGYLAAALVTGLAAIGAGIAVAAAAPAAIGAFSEDPKSFGKSMIFVAMGEGVAIYGLLISILILNKL